MGDVLAGLHSTWELGPDSVLIRYGRGIRTPRLFHTLGKRHVPYEALRAVELLPGTRRGTVVLRVTPREGADPLMEAAGGQLKEACDPYRLVLPAADEPRAVRCAAALRAALRPDADQPAPWHLVAAPAPPHQFKAYDGKASFDGVSVSFRWFRTGASSAKWKAGDQRFEVSGLAGVEWRSPEVFPGHLRLLPRATDDGPGGGAARAAGAGLPTDQDPATVLFGLGYGLVHESLPFAASVLEAVRAAAPAPVLEPVSGGTAVAGRREPDGHHCPAQIADRIRHLGELHQAGLVTDEEFTAKKAQLLAEL